MQLPGVPPALLQALGSAAGEGRLALVGGAVRDLLLHHQHQDPWRGLPDLDLVFEGRAVELVQRLPGCLPAAAACSWREHGSFGTVAVEVALPGEPLWLLDVASARCEAYPVAAENPRVRWGALEQDLARRDFSVNAIALVLHRDGGGAELLDPHGGRCDLRERRLRVLHPASFLDDPTRLVRAARYAARLGFSLEPSTLAQARSVLTTWPWDWKPGAAAALAPAALGTRLRMELELLLEREPWHAALTQLQSWGALALLDQGLQRSDRWAWAIRRADRLRLPRLCALLACGADPAAVAARLQLPHRQQRWLQALMEQRRALASVDWQAWGAAQWTEWLERGHDATAVVALALACGDQPRRPLLHWWLRWRHVQAPVTARELLAQGMWPGPALGERLRHLRAQRLLALEGR